MMKGRVLGLFAIALLGGCSLRPWTPSVSVAFWAEDVPALKSVSLPTSAELTKEWQLAPNDPWGRYTKATLASALDPMGATAELPDIARLEVVSDARAAASRVAQAGLPRDALWVVDLRGAASCAFGAQLSRAAKEPVSTVTTFNNWPSPEGLVPADETLAGLLAFAPKVPDEAETAKGTQPVFLLDSWRLAYRDDDPGPDVYDNRYMLTAADLPDAATLHAQGITRVIYVVEDLDDAEVEEDDLHASFRAWQAAGIGIHFVDLAFLKEVGAPSAATMQVDWARSLAPRSYWVRERYTLMDDPFFYARARAGFGMAYGRPLIRPGYHGGSGYRSSGSGG